MIVLRFLIMVMVMLTNVWAGVFLLLSEESALPFSYREVPKSRSRDRWQWHKHDPVVTLRFLIMVMVMLTKVGGDHVLFRGTQVVSFPCCLEQ